MERELLEAAFKTILEYSSDMIFLKDTNLIYRAASAPFVKMVGKTSADEIIGRTDREIFSEPQLARRYEMDDHHILSSQKNMLSFVEPITDENGQPRYGSTSKYLLRGENGEIIGILGVTKDVTMEYFARRHYQQEFRYLFDLPEDTYAVCYIDVDDWRIIKQRRQQIVNGTLQEGQTVEEICKYAVESILNPEDKAVKFYKNFRPEELRKIYASGRRSLEFEYERVLSDASARWVHNEIHFLTDIDSNHLCVMLSAKDINQSKQEEKRMLAAAKHDQMTGVLNRETAMEQIRQLLEEKKAESHALFMLDIDNFKMLNDTFGHQTGDEFLIRLAKGLKETFSECDIIGRIGGDEFFVFIKEMPEQETIEKKAKELLAFISLLAKDYIPVELSGSIGISIYPKDGEALEVLYAKADKALYQVKHHGKNGYKFID